VKALDSTKIAVVHPEDSLDTQNFGVSHFYWSFDGYLELQDGSYTADFKHPNGTKYCDQVRISFLKLYDCGIQSVYLLGLSEASV